MTVMILDTRSSDISEEVETRPYPTLDPTLPYPTYSSRNDHYPTLPYPTPPTTFNPTLPYRIKQEQSVEISWDSNKCPGTETSWRRNVPVQKCAGAETSWAEMSRFEYLLGETSYGRNIQMQKCAGAKPLQGENLLGPKLSWAKMYRGRMFLGHPSAWTETSRDPNVPGSKLYPQDRSDTQPKRPVTACWYWILPKRFTVQ